MLRVLATSSLVAPAATWQRTSTSRSVKCSALQQHWAGWSAGVTSSNHCLLRRHVPGGLGPPGGSYERMYTHAKRRLGRERYTGVATSPNSRTRPARAREAVTAARGSGNARPAVSASGVPGRLREVG